MHLAVKIGTHPNLHEQGQRESHGSVEITCLVPDCGETYAIYLKDNADAESASGWLQEKLQAEHDAGKRSRQAHPDILTLPPTFEVQRGRTR